MNKALYISGVIFIVALLAMRVIPYFEGLAFDKFWSVPLGIFPLGVVALLTFIGSSLVCFVSVVRRRRSPRGLIIVGVFPLLVVALYQAPIPSYIDGMHKTIVESLSKKELVEFAVDARLRNPEWIKHEEHDQIIKPRKYKHLKPLTLSPIPPRIEVNEDYISVFYGSALVKHWGYVIGNVEEFPKTHIPESMYKKVYDGVWVYHDIW